MTQIRTDWTREEIAELFDLPFTELLFRAATVHRDYHPPEQIQLCTLLSIKTGGCPEDCGYCSQSVHADSGVEATRLMDVRSSSPIERPGPRMQVRSASAWVLPGVIPKTATCLRSWRS